MFSKHYITTACYNFILQPYYPLHNIMHMYRPLHTISASLVLQLCARHHSTVPATLPNHERDQQALQRFLAGYTPYENAAAAVWRSLWSLPISGLAWDQLPESERKLVIMKVLQNHPWPHCISTLQLTGIKQARKLLRQALARGFHWTLSN